MSRSDFIDLFLPCLRDLGGTESNLTCHLVDSSKWHLGISIQKFFDSRSPLAFPAVSEFLPDVRVRWYEDRDEAGVLAVLREALPGSKSETPDLWRWKHTKGAFGPSYVVVAEADGGEIAAVTALMRWRLRHEGEVWHAGRPVDTATSAKFRRLGIFRRMTEFAMTELPGMGVPFGLSTPNTESMPGFLRLGWSKVDIESGLIRPCKPLRLSFRVIRHRLRKSEPAPSGGLFRMSELAEHPLLGRLVDQYNTWDRGNLRTDKTQAYLAWRYSGLPERHYEALWREHEGRMLGALVVRPYVSRGLRVLAVMELITADADPELGRTLVRDAIAAADPDIITAHFARDSVQHQALASAGFRGDPRPSPAVISIALDRALEEQRTEASWGLTMGDLEFL